MNDQKSGQFNGTQFLKLIQEKFAQIPDSRVRSSGNSLKSCLLSCYAMFALKYSSLLQFDKDSRKECILNNLKTVFGIEGVPSDTQMRERLDLVSPEALRPVFKALFALTQRNKKLEPLQYHDQRYIVSIDGTGYFSSNEIHCEHCCAKEHKDGTISYYHQMLVATLVHPDYKTVIPFAPEPILKADGAKKNDCERCAAGRLLTDFKREHPHLRVIITGDGLFSNGPFIKRLKEDGHSFILVANEGDHKSLFEDFNSLPHKESFEKQEGKVTHHFEWAHSLPLNASHPDCLVNVLEYQETNANGVKKRWVWVTDQPLNPTVVYKIMRGGRARHKIENETFNTLKNQGYNFEHNYGHGNNNLSTVMANIMLLAFAVDQLKQMSCPVFSKALEEHGSKKNLWEKMRALFFNFFIQGGLSDLWDALAYGIKHQPLAPNNTS